MKRLLVALLISSVGLPLLHAQSFWMWNQRTHPELEWSTLETEHFRIHYHQGIEYAADKTARIAEQIYQPVLDQLQIDGWGITDIVLSAEDEIMNGFAMPSDQIFIWVSQNDVAGRFGGSEKWLRLVVTHEFQHVAQLHAHDTWAGVFSLISVPGWWIEGMAEYMTEEWRVGRSDSRLKIHTYQNSMQHLGPHDQGYAMVKYLAWKYGDSTLVNISNHRMYLDEENKKFPIWYDFNEAFEASTGTTVKTFYEEWRRVMNAYYYSYLAQKESVEETGTPLRVNGFHEIHSLSFSADSSQLVLVGRQNKRMLDQGVYTLTLDTNHTIESYHHGVFRGIPAISPDNQYIAVAELHRGSHGSLLNDLRLIETESGKTRWITEDFRALHPEFSPDGLSLIFVAHPEGETSQLYRYDKISEELEQLTAFAGDVQLQRPVYSPDGNRIAFMIQDASGAVDIAVVDSEGNDFTKITNDRAEDLLPVWTEDGGGLVLTSFRNSTPNLYRVDLDSMNLIPMTDVAQGIYSLQSVPNSNLILSSTLPDVDSVRIMLVDADRIAGDFPVNIRDRYTDWRVKMPDVAIPDIDYDADISQYTRGPYRPFSTIRPLVWAVLPDVEGLFGMGVFNDAMGKHLFQGGGVLGWQGDLLGGFVSYMNLNHAPILQVYGTKNFNFSFRNYHRGQIIEARDGIGLAAALPFSARNGLRTNHWLQARFDLVQRNQNRFGDDWDAVPTNAELPRDESKLGLSYLVKHQRPERQQVTLPGHGRGFLAHFEQTVPGLWGAGDYQQIWLDGFINQRIPKTPLVIYNRSKWQRQSGTIAYTDSIGFSEVAPYYFSPGTLLGITSVGLLDLPETYSLRGQQGDYPATEVFINTFELRWPLFNKLPINVLGIGAGGLSGALFSDFGYLPELERSLHTFGMELKFAVMLERMPLLVLAGGIGGDSSFWQQVLDEDPSLKIEEQLYLRMSLVNPF